MYVGCFFLSPDLWDGVYLLLAQKDKARPVLTDQQERYGLPQLLTASPHTLFFIPPFLFLNCMNVFSFQCTLT